MHSLSGTAVPVGAAWLVWGNTLPLARLLDAPFGQLYSRLCGAF